MLTKFYTSRKGATALMITALTASGGAWADAQDTLNFSLGATARFEENLFRLPDSANTTAVLGKSQRSDQILTTNAGIKIDKPYSLQRFQFDAAVVDNRYKTYDHLDYTAFNYRAAWLWHLTPNISGMLMADQQQVLNSFSDYRDANNLLIRSRSIQTNQSRIFNADALVGGGWHLLGGISEFRSRNSQTFNAVGDYVQTGGELGIKYVTPSENAVSLIQRASKGDYQGRVADPVNQLDTGFDQRETEARVFWHLTGKSQIDARLGYVDREHDHFSSRDYDGTTGRLGYIWTPTDNLRINASIARNLSSYQQAANSYYVADSFSISPVWQVDAKVNLRVSYDYSQRDYLGAIVAIPEKRKDNVQTFLFAAEWKPTRTITVNGALQRETRDSSFNNPIGAGGDLRYDANSATLGVQLLF